MDACGIPVVVSNTLNYAEEIAQAEAGLVVQRTPQEFGAAILHLLGDSVLRRTMGRCGRILAHKYSLEETAVKVEAAIESVLRRCPFPQDLAPMMVPENQA